VNGYILSVTSPKDLAATLSTVSPSEYVRFVADWMERATDLDEAPMLTGMLVVDAFVAAAAAHVAFVRSVGSPRGGVKPAPRRNYV
jgi:hypothetical protein